MGNDHLFSSDHTNLPVFHGASEILKGKTRLQKGLKRVVECNSQWGEKGLWFSRTSGRRQGEVTRRTIYQGTSKGFHPIIASEHQPRLALFMLSQPFSWTPLFLHLFGLCRNLEIVLKEVQRGEILYMLIKARRTMLKLDRWEQLGLKRRTNTMKKVFTSQFSLELLQWAVVTGSVSNN